MKKSILKVAKFGFTFSAWYFGIAILLLALTLLALVVNYYMYE